MTVKTDFVYNSYFFRKKILKIDLFLHSLHVSTPLIYFMNRNRGRREKIKEEFHWN